MKALKQALKRTKIFSLYLKLKKVKNKIRSKISKYMMLRIILPSSYNKYKKSPINEKKVIFLEVRGDDITNSFKLLFDELTSNYDLDIHSHFLRNASAPQREYLKRCIEFVEDLATAKYVFINDACNVLSCVELRSETIVTQTWHGCGAFKKFGLSTAELLFGDSKAEILKYPYYANLTHVTLSSPEVAWAYEEAMNLKDTPQVVKALGQSRTDVFYDEDFIQKSYEKLHMIMPSSKGKKVILYAPTFRGRVAKAQAPNVFNIDMFNKAFGDEYVVIFKYHPFVKRPPVVPDEYYDFAADLTQCMAIEELLCVSDICISDYSSLVFEYSIFEKPMIFFAYDLDEYCDWRGFYYNYDELTPGPVCPTNSSMIEYIKEIDTLFEKQRVVDFRNKFMSSCDGHATQRILKATFGENLSKYKRDIPLPNEYNTIPSATPMFGAKQLEIKNLSILKARAEIDYKKEIKNPVTDKKVLFLNKYKEVDFIYNVLQEELSKIDGVLVKNLFSVDNVFSAEVVKEIATSQYIVLAHAFDIINVLDIRKETTVVQLWNSVFPMKNFGYCNAGVIGGIHKDRLKVAPIHKNYGLVPVASEKFVDIFKASFNIEGEGVVKPIGCPSTDFFFNQRVKEKVWEKLLEIFPEAEGKKVIIYMPQCRHTKRLPDRKILLVNQLFNEYLTGEYVVLGHYNPLTRRDMPQVSKYYKNCMRNMTGILTIYELLSIADIVVGDYRPQTFEFASTGKPVFVYTPDRDIYFRENQSNFEYGEVIPGVEVEDTMDLIEKIKDIEHYDYTNVENLRKNYFANCDGEATKRLIDIMIKK